MQNEFIAMGIEVHFVSINVTSGLESAEKLVEVCGYPLLQDTEEIGAWDLLQGKKDDMYILNTDGAVATYLPQGGVLSTNLSTEEGYNNVKYSLYEVLGLATPDDWPPVPAEDSSAEGGETP